MALELLTTTAFEKDMRRVRKQGTGGGPIAGALQPASVTRDWTGHWDCHVEPDWLLLYRLTGKQLALVRTGSHTELFG